MADGEPHPRDRAPGLVRDLRAAGWLIGVDDGRVERAVEGAVRDLSRRHPPERGALERDLLMLDPRTRNAAFPVSLKDGGFDLMLPTADGAVVPVPVQADLPPGGSGVAAWRFDFAGQERRLAVRVHDGLYNRGLAVRGVNRVLDAAGVPWRYHEVLAGAVPVVVLTEADGRALRRLCALNFLTELPAGGGDDPAPRRAVERAAALRALGVLHEGLGDDLIRRAFSGPRRFLDALPDDLLGNHVAALDGLSVFHVDSLRTYDGDRHKDFAEGLFRIAAADFAGATVTALDSTPTEEGPTDLEFAWDGAEFRITFDQQAGVVELRVVHALNALLGERRPAGGGRFHALAPVTQAASGHLAAAVLVLFAAPAQADALRARALVRFADLSLDPAALAPGERPAVTQL